jgi:ribA/ribD-fused uncharacterized protein
MKVIDHFAGEYAFLSNFYYPAEVVYDGETYRTTEHAYQASKVLSKDYRQKIKNTSRASEAKKLGKKKAMAKAGVKLRDDWDNIKLDVMFDLLRQKFQHPELKKKLLDTGDAELIEGNWWGDYFWGTVQGEGENHLGRLLMKVRSELR